VPVRVTCKSWGVGSDLKFVCPLMGPALPGLILTVLHGPPSPIVECRVCTWVLYKVLYCTAQCTWVISESARARTALYINAYISDLGNFS
jgi:hypothetical protein